MGEPSQVDDRGAAQRSLARFPDALSRGLGFGVRDSVVLRLVGSGEDVVRAEYAARGA